MNSHYIPALSFKWLTPLYDPLLKWVMREETFKRHLILQANIQPNMHLLDLGCGTGRLTVMLKRAHPGAEVTGLDGDQQVLEIARQKSRGTDDKRLAFKEIYRVLKPQGELHVLDFGAPHSALTRFMTTYMRHLEEVADNFDGLIPNFITEAGFGFVSETQHFLTIFGSLSLWRAVKG